MRASKRLQLSLIFMLIFHSFAYAGGSLINIKKIIQIESSGNARAWNKGEDARGLCQVRICVLREYNERHSKRYSMQDLFIPEINIEIASWYLEKRIPQMLRHYGIAVTPENVIIAYNAGINYLVRHKPIPQTTRRYLLKYGR